MQFQVVPVVLSLSGAFLFACSASAQIRYDLDLVFDGAETPPVNPAGPWVQATFADLSPDHVLFTLEATANLTSPENVRQFYFNFDDGLDVDSLDMTPVSASGSFTLPSWTLSENGLKADGDGMYDVRLDFNTGAVDLGFTRNESVTYLLTYSGPGSMDETSFVFESEPAGGTGPFYAAAHVQNTIAGGSAWLAANTVQVTLVPEPSGLGLGALAGLALLIRRMRSG